MDRALSDAPHAAAVIMGQYTGPEKLRPGVVIFRFPKGDGKVLDNCAEDTFTQIVGQIVVLPPCEIPFMDMGHDINGSARGLKRRKGIA